MYSVVLLETGYYYFNTQELIASGFKGTIQFQGTEEECIEFINTPEE